MDRIILKMRKELLENIDRVYKKGSVNFFHEPVHPLGVRTPVVRRIAGEFWKKLWITEMPDHQAGIPDIRMKKERTFALCEMLLERRTFEETLIAFQWARMMEKDLTIKDFSRFERWLKTYVDNWAFCDDFCTHVFGSVVTRNVSLLPRVHAWRTSKNRWLRRASAVILIHPMHSPTLSTKQKRVFLKPIFETAEVLCMDQDDLVQKGYGWMLKEASKIFPAEIFNFVIEYKDTMPRTALRYAIEKYPEEMRREAMK